MENKNRFQGEFAFYCKLFAAAVLTYLLFRFGLPLVAPFVAAFLLSALLRPAVLYLNRRCRIPQPVSAVLFLVLFLAVLCFLLFFLGRLLFRQVSLFFENYTGFQTIFFGYAGRVCYHADGFFKLKPGTALQLFSDGVMLAGEFVETKLLPQLSEASLSILKEAACIVAKAVFMFVAALLMLTRKEKSKENGLLLMPGLKRILNRLSETGIAFLKTQGILILLVAAVCSVGFLFVKPEYALLLGLLVAVVDAFPVLGSGLILMPWAILSLFQGRGLAAGALFLMYVCCLLIRQILEPKLLGNRIGLPALSALFAVYIGVELFGIAGVVLGPFLFVIIQTVLHELLEKEKGEGKGDYD